MTAKRLLLHIGHPKTGTTSLQETFAASADHLRRQGVEFPLLHTTNGNSVILIYHLFGVTEHTIPFQDWLMMDYDTAVETSRACWQELCRKMTQGTANTVVISAENAFRPLSKKDINHLLTETRLLAEQTEIIAYIRAPHTTFLSALQQVLRARQFHAPTPLGQLRQTIEPLQEKWPDRVSLSVFDPTIMIDGDIVTDFISKYLPEIDPQTLTTPDPFQNKSLSAEAMSLLMDIHKARCRKPRNWPLFLEHLHQADERIPEPTKPVLLQEAAQSLINRSSDDLHWLRDKNDIVFNDIDYDAITPDGFDQKHIDCTRIEDISPVNRARKLRLQRQTFWATALPRGFRRWAKKL